MWIRLTVRADQTVITEIVITGIETVEVTTISINHLTVFSGPAAWLVNKIPNKTSLILRIFANQIPILFKTTFRITHRMSILALNQRFWTIRILCIFLTVFISVIHRTINIRFSVKACSFILYSPTGIFSLYPFVSSFKVRSVTSFVTQRPEDNAWMIETTLNIALITF